MTVRADVRLDDAPMTSVACVTCGARVAARKSSWEQTTIQWSDDAIDTCVERRAAAPRPGPNGEAFLGCSALGQSLREAAVMGNLPVLDVDPARRNQESA